MSQAIADSIRGRCGIIAVNDAHRLAPFADALVANDLSWWKAHPEALDFQGRKFCALRYPGTERLKTTLMCPGGSNSGLQGCRVAWEQFSATLILLLGFDMRGAHFFGAHAAPLKNPTPDRFAKFIRQFGRWKGCEIINCTPGSALTQFPFGDVDEILRTRRA